MILTRLREETAAVHKRLEARLDLMSPQLSIARYTRILQAFLAFFEIWEAALTRDCPAEFAQLWEGRRRSHLLHADLANLGSAPDLRLAGAVPLPPLFDAGTWLGAVYVLEGSRLGGQHISKHLEKNFGWHGGTGYSFFHGDKHDVATHWRALLSVLEAHCQWSNQITEGAHRTFSSLLGSFDLSVEPSSIPPL